MARLEFDGLDLERAPDPARIEAFLRAMSDFWQPAAWSRDLAERALRGVRVLGKDLVLARLDGTVVALRDACRHFQARLSLGEVVELDGAECVQCPYHGWTYGRDGRCVRIPQLAPERSISRAAAVPVYPVVERYGIVWVCLSGHPRFDVPAFPEFDDAAFRTVLLTEPTMTRANALRMIIGTLDDTHFPWVHEGILGSRDDCRPPEHGAVREGRYLEVHYEIEQPPNLATTDVSAADGQEAVPITYTNHVGMPNVIRLVKDSDSGRYVIWLASCAVAHDVTVNYWAFSRNYDMAPERDAVYREFSQAVRDQDKPIIESQRPVLVPPLDAGVALAMSPADRPLIEYIRWLDELGLTVYP